MKFANFKYGLILRYLATVIAGALIALAVYQMWSLETRYMVVAVAGVVLIAFSMAFLRQSSDFLLVALLFCIPLTNFCKYLLIGSYSDRDFGILRYSGTLSIGPVELLLIALYGMWFIRIVVTREDKPPHFEKPDIVLLLLLAAYVFSIPGTPIAKSGVFGVLYLGRYLLVYLYVSRHFERRHITWLLLAIAAALIIETSLAGVQYTTGKFVGIALDRGQGVRIHDQYAVPGIEHRTRATGTVSESHTFGIYMAMLLMYAFAMVGYRGVSRSVRTLALGLFLAGAVAILVSFSRATWVSCAIALALMWYVRVAFWGEKQIVLPTLALPLLLAPLLPWGIEIIVERFETAGGELLQARFEQYPVAWAIWMDHFFFGYGLGNYMEALKTYNFGGAARLPVHNAFLWAAAETGLFGVLAFIGVLVGALRRCWRLVRAQREPICRIALAGMAGLVAYALDGLTDPLYREPVVFMMVWVTIAVSVALIRIDRESLENASGSS